MPKIRVLDFETSGFPPSAGVLEVGFTDVGYLPDGRYFLSGTQTRLCNPGFKINIEAMAVHHITEEMVKGLPPAQQVLQELEGDAHEKGIEIWCAHNAKFEKAFFRPPQPWICTYKCGTVLWPGSPKHTNQVLRYYLGVDADPIRAEPAHRAGPDTYVTALLLIKALQARPIAELLALSESLLLLPVCTFGKYKGMPWSEVPKDYLRWIIGNRDYTDENVKHTANYWLAH